MEQKILWGTVPVPPAAAGPPPAPLFDEAPPPHVGRLKGRGTAWAIAHRHARVRSEPFDDGWGPFDPQSYDEDFAPPTRIVEQRAVTILAKNDSPDLPFELSVNPYRGCEHGCIYCFARPTHGYLDASPGLDFETRIVAKINAAERLREALADPRYVPRPISVGSATDCYQPAERRLGLTRKVIEVLAGCAHPFSIVTKSSGVERDLDLIAPLAARRLVAVVLSVTTLDPALARIMEPRAAAPHRRLRTIETLARAGMPVGVSVSPLIPFVNEPELERILAAVRDAGARSAFGTVLRLPGEVGPLFRHWLELHFPERAERILARVREMHGGQEDDGRFGIRMRGQGVWADLLAQRFQKACARLGLNREVQGLDTAQFVHPRRRRAEGQGELF